MAVTVNGMTPLLQVFDMPTSIAFYCDVLGFTIHSKSSEDDNFYWAWLKLGDIDLMLNTAYEDHDRPASPVTQRVAAHRDTTLYFGCPDVDSTFELLRDKCDIVHEPENTFYGMRQLTIKDPDGYLICFQWPVE